MDFWRHLLDSGEAGEIEARLRRYDGDYRWFLFRIEPVRDNRGDIFKWYGANTDIRGYGSMRLTEERSPETILAKPWLSLPTSRSPDCFWVANNV